MLEAVISLPYFGSFHFFKELINYEKICIEKFENFQKQTYRNRQYIYGANGKLMLNIPVKHSKSSVRRKYADCQIENSFKWQELHFKSLETAYRTSPYFEYYEDDFIPLYKKHYESLFDFNLDCFNTILELLHIDVEISFSERYKENYDDNLRDLRPLISAKTNNHELAFKPYHQVFESKHGFIENLSILDALFNLGPETTSFLKS